MSDREVNISPFPQYPLVSKAPQHLNDEACVHKLSLVASNVPSPSKGLLSSQILPIQSHDLRPLPMSVGFGFSAGDFISALELVSTIVGCLRESGSSSSEYRALISQFYTLETALLRVKALKLDDSQHAEVVALRAAASQCQRTIDAFWEKIKKYQPSLRAGGSGSGTGSKVKDGWMKIKWALCQKEDLVRFKAELMGHTESIEILLATVQM
jgi:hypothetical protein